MKTLVIGAAGFVGPYLIRHLTEIGHTVLATKLPQEQISTPCTTYTTLNLDILDADAVCTLLADTQPDWIVHLAAQSSVALSWQKPQLTADINIKGTLNLLEAARQLPQMPRILLIGSGEEYGQLTPEQYPVTEDTPLHPANIYAATKAAAEQLAAVYTRAYAMHIVAVRAFNHIGAGQSSAFAVSDFCKQAAEIELGLRAPVIYTGNLTAQRDFTDVRDIVRAYSMLMEHGKAGAVYNVGSGRAVSLAEILRQIQSLAAVPFTAETDPQKLRPVDVPVIAADITRMQTDTGWQPQYPLRQTLSDILQYWRDALKTGAM